MNNKVFKILDMGRSILEIEKVIEATKYMKKNVEVRKAMINLKERVVNEILKEYSHIDDKETSSNELMYSVENSSYEIEEGHIKEPEEDKTLEELSEEDVPEEEEIPDKFIEPPKPRIKSKVKSEPKAKKNPYDKKKS